MSRPAYRDVRTGSSSAVSATDACAVRAQFVRFAAVGVMGFAVDASILTLLVTVWDWHHYAARAISFGCAVTATWACNRHWAFAPTTNTGREYGGYFVVQSVGAAINLGTYVFLIERFPSLSSIPVIPLAIGAGLALIFNFLASRRFVFAAEAKTMSPEQPQSFDLTDRVSSYSGRENLEAMEHAANYNEYLLSLLMRNGCGGRVLDFGAGTGTFARPLKAQGWDVTCLEPDAVLGNLLREEGLPVVADLGELADASVDFVYSFNVLEHIEDDQAVLDGLHARLKVGGRLLLYVPAFDCLYSAMDRQVGHCRRYRRQGLERQVRDAGFAVIVSRYADSIGFFASLVYKLLGGSGKISPRSVSLYDRYVFPASRRLDRLAGRFFGKNLVVIARK